MKKSTNRKMCPCPVQKSELDGKEVIDRCSKNWTTTSELHGGEESTKQESQNTVKSKTIARLEAKIGLKKIIMWLKLKKSK